MSLKALLSEYGKKLINLLKDEGVKLLEEVPLGFLSKILKRKRKSGHPVVYDRPRLFKLVVEAWSEGYYKATEIARYAKKPLVKLRYWVTKSPSHDVISDFLIELQEKIENIFYKLVELANKLKVVKEYSSKIIDTTPVETKFKSDSDAKWNPGIKKGEWYWGYGGLIIVDEYTHLPCAAELTKNKKVNAQQSIEVTDKAMNLLNFDTLLGDSEFDMKKLRQHTERKSILLITAYNPRNTKQAHPIKLRNEITYNLNKDWTYREYNLRPEIEHSIGTTKENFGLEQIQVKGYKKVRTHYFLTLCIRLIHGIATFKKGLNPRRVTMN